MYEYKTEDGWIPITSTMLRGDRFRTAVDLMKTWGLDRFEFELYGHAHQFRKVEPQDVEIDLKDRT